MWTETHRTAAKEAIAGDIAAHDAAVLPTIRSNIEAGVSMRKTAEKLNKLNFPSPGNRSRTTHYRDNWTAPAVWRICRRHRIRFRDSAGPRVCKPGSQPSKSPRHETPSPVRSHGSLLTPERWERARQVLHGEHQHGVSLTAAARAAGVPRRTVVAWIQRACERRAGDDWLLTKVADDYKIRHEIQGEVLEDELWRRIWAGQKRSIFNRGKKVGEHTVYDNKLLVAFLRARDPKYRTQKRRNGGSPKPEPRSPEEERRSLETVSAVFEEVRALGEARALEEEELESAAEKAQEERIRALKYETMMINAEAEETEAKIKRLEAGQDPTPPRTSASPARSQCPFDVDDPPTTL